MASLQDIVAYCDSRLGIPEFPDYPGACNGLQMANHGSIAKIAAAVDAGLEVFRATAARGANLLLVHHGMFWQPPHPFTGASYEKLRLLLEANLAVYSAHLPLDAHPEIGNNALLVRQLDLGAARPCFPFEGRDIGLIATNDVSRAALKHRLQSLFPRVTAIEYGAEVPAKIAVVTGGGYGVIETLPASGADTLITGELKEHCFNLAQELRLNLYACGHYATEVFGVRALAAEAAERFQLPWEFVATENPI